MAAAAAGRYNGTSDTCKKIRLHFFESPGDTLCGTAALESLHKQYPGQYVTDVSGTAAHHIYENNPHWTPIYDSDVQTISMKNVLVSQSDHRPVHVLQSYTHSLAEQLGIKLDCSTNRPHLHVSSDEKKWKGQVEEIVGKKVPYWVVCSGVKRDYTIKGYGSHHYQEVVDMLRGVVQFVQIGEKGHNHKKMENVIDLRGKTDTRQLIRLCWNAHGGLGGESFLHHIFAALSKPFVCLASGFLPPAWVSYPTTTILHRQGCLPCWKQKACWKSRVVKLGDGDKKDASLCLLPVLGGAEPVPKCLAMIKPEEVVAAIRAYYEGGVLSF